MQEELISAGFGKQPESENGHHICEVQRYISIPRPSVKYRMYTLNGMYISYTRPSCIIADVAECVIFSDFTLFHLSDPTFDFKRSSTAMCFSCRRFRRVDVLGRSAHFCMFYVHLETHLLLKFDIYHNTRVSD